MPARNPPTSAPTMPRTMCPMTPRPSSPLTRNPARYPAIAPMTIHAMMLIRNLHPRCGPLTRLLGRLVYPEDRDPASNVAGLVPREDNGRRVLRNNGLSAHSSPESDLQSICDVRAYHACVHGMPGGGCSAPERRSTTG